MGIIGILGCLAHWIDELVNDTLKGIFSLTLRDSYRPVEEFENDLPMGYILRQCRSANLVVLLHKIRKPPRILQQRDRGKMTEDFLAAARWLKSRPDTTGKLGAVGFCFGGGVVNQLAVLMGPDLAAGVPFYGAQPSAADAAKIKAPINAQYGEQDTRITDGWPAFDAALTEAKVPHEGHVYKGANHGFHNDTTPRYDEAAAKEAWPRTLDWFNKYLRG